MDAIYTDRQQCEHFGISYFDPGSWTVSADALLDSKVRSGGYDEQHTTFLSSFGQKTIHLVRWPAPYESFGPGWWRVKRPYPGRPFVCRDTHDTGDLPTMGQPVVAMIPKTPRVWRHTSMEGCDARDGSTTGFVFSVWIPRQGWLLDALERRRSWSTADRAFKQVSKWIEEVEEACLSMV